MSLKDHLKEAYNKAYSENDSLEKEKIVVKWVHRFGFNSLSDLLIQITNLKREFSLEESQEQINLIEEELEEESQEQINFKLLETAEYAVSNNLKLTDDKYLKKDISCDKKQLINKNSNNYAKTQNLPLPHIKNLRKWINKKAS